MREDYGFIDADGDGIITACVLGGEGHGRKRGGRGGRGRGGGASQGDGGGRKAGSAAGQSRLHSTHAAGGARKQGAHAHTRAHAVSELPREDLRAFNAGVSADEGLPAIGDGQLEFSLKLFDLNQASCHSQTAHSTSTFWPGSGGGGRWGLVCSTCSL